MNNKEQCQMYKQEAVSGKNRQCKQTSPTREEANRGVDDNVLA